MQTFNGEPEIHCICEKKDKALYIKYYLSSEERKEILKLGEAACLLYEFYLRMASIPQQSMEDDVAIKYFGWNIHKVRRYRQVLHKNGWFNSVRFTYTNSNKGITYYVGKNAVRQSLANKGRSLFVGTAKSHKHHAP